MRRAILTPAAPPFTVTRVPARESRNGRGTVAAAMPDGRSASQLTCLVCERQFNLKVLWHQTQHFFQSDMQARCQMSLNMKNDRRVNSWGELQQELYRIDKNSHGRYRTNFVYRGVADKSWGLQTSLQRIGRHYGGVEGPLLRNFLKYAGPHEVDSNALLFQLAVAQHHGLPTRVLDWTTSPKVAAHFATWEEKDFDKDGAIWCVDVIQARALLPEPLWNKLDEERAIVFSIEMLADYKKLFEFDALGTRDEFVLFFEPPSLDGRIVNQGAILSIMPGAHLDLKDLLEKNDHLYRRIIIPAEMKWELRDKLDQDNVTERMLFPGLDGTSRWLKRYYGPGPNSNERSQKEADLVGRAAAPSASGLPDDGSGEVASSKS